MPKPTFLLDIFYVTSLPLPLASACEVAYPSTLPPPVSLPLPYALHCNFTTFPHLSLSLKLKLQYFGHLMWRADSLEKTLMLGGIGGRRRRDDRGQDGWMGSPTQWTWVWASSGRWWRTGKPGVLQSMGSQNRTWLSDWTTTTHTHIIYI